MASIPPIASEPVAHVFRIQPGYPQLEEIPQPVWQQIVQHQLPLQPANATIKLLLLQGQQYKTQELHRYAPVRQDPASRLYRLNNSTGANTDNTDNNEDTEDTEDSASQNTCHSIDALQLQTDGFGFLMTWDASTVTSTVTAPTTAPATSSSTNLPSTNNTPGSSRKTGTVIDLRERFLQRYIAHRHAWHPSRHLLVQALTQAGYVTHTD